MLRALCRQVSGGPRRKGTKDGTDTIRLMPGGRCDKSSAGQRCLRRWRPRPVKQVGVRNVCPAMRPRRRVGKNQAYTIQGSREKRSLESVTSHTVRVTRQLLRQSRMPYSIERYPSPKTTNRPKNISEKSDKSTNVKKITSCRVGATPPRRGDFFLNLRVKKASKKGGKQHSTFVTINICKYNQVTQFCEK